MKHLLVALAFLFSTVAQAQWSPGKETVQAIIPFAPGGGTDAAFRHFQKYADQNGVTIAPVYKGGAEGVIGMTDVANGKTDGYTIGFGTQATAMAYRLKHPNSDFEYVSVLRGSIMTMATHPNNPINNLSDLERFVRNPDNKGSFAYGSPSQKEIWEQYFEFAKAKHNPTLVPYKGGGPAVNDALGGHVDFIVVPLSIIKSHIDAGKLKLIAVSIRKPWKEVAGYENLNKKYPTWENNDGFLITLPAGVSKEVSDFWKKFVAKYLEDPQVLQDFYKEYTEPQPFGPEYARKGVDAAVQKQLKGKK